MLCVLYCAQKSIRVVGDIAIFVDYDSADVWAHTELYRLNENLDPEVVSGVRLMRLAQPGNAGESALQLGRHAGARLRMVDSAAALGYADLRLHSVLITSVVSPSFGRFLHITTQL